MASSNTSVTRVVSHCRFGVSDESAVIFSWIFYITMCQVLNIFGVITNIINIVCFMEQGFRESTNVSLLGLAVSDIGCLTTQFVTNVFYTPVLQTADLGLEPREVIYLISTVPHVTFSRISSWITATIALERCLCVTAPLKIKRIFTTKQTSIVIACIYVISFCSSAPVYVVNKLDFKFSSLRNKTIYGVVSTENREIVETVTFTINNFVFPFIAFIIVFMCTIILVFKLKSAAKWRQESADNSQSQNISIRNQKVSKMVVMISSLFIVCFVPISLGMFAYALVPDLYFNGRCFNISIIIGGLSFFLESINSSMNIIIYYRMSTKFRCSFKMLLSQPQKNKKINK